MLRPYNTNIKYSLRVKHDISEVIDIFTREDNEKSRMWFRMNCTSGIYTINCGVPSQNRF